MISIVILTIPLSAIYYSYRTTPSYMGLIYASTPRLPLDWHPIRCYLLFTFTFISYSPILFCPTICYFHRSLYPTLPPPSLPPLIPPFSQAGEEDIEADAPKTGKNQFNYSERAAQTFNNTLRTRGVATEPPPVVRVYVH
jgi:hypothetical protein